MSRSKGFEIEEAAQSYLYHQGLMPITQNFLCKMGEIDLIMRNQEGTLIFIEVRYREQSNYGDGAETITPRKQQKLRNTALFYMLKHHSTTELDCRFDVISASPDFKQDGTISFNWIKNAF